jgi:uncharacterized protein YbbC (DUF1343 family)
MLLRVNNHQISVMGKITFLCLMFPYLVLGCIPKTSTKGTTQEVKHSINKKDDIKTGADQTEKYLPLLKGKNVGLVINPTAEIDGINLADTLKSAGVNIKAIFGPEHGFRGDADAGEKVGNYIDKKSGIPVISLYGPKKAPSKDDLKDLDIVVFDIQDVGARFYTYTITLADVMQACADNKVPLLILDRPNPNGELIDGPILDPAFKSGVGMHKIPITHGLTIAEFAKMVNGEKWLKNNAQCNIKIIEMANYHHGKEYNLPVKPSPNLPNMLSIYLYPSTCLFEGTAISQGRGTTYPFQVLGHPLLKDKYSFSFKPVSIKGMSKNPPLENEVCYGIDFRKMPLQEIRNQKQIDLKLLLDLYNDFPEKDKFFTPFFNKLAGTDQLMKQVKEGKSEAEIRKSWEDGLTKYKETRKKYLLYN